MWSRPIRIAEENTFQRDADGIAARSSHTEDACVMVTSFRAPRPEMITPARKTAESDTSGKLPASSWAASPSVPVIPAGRPATRAATTVIAMPPNVPSTAVVVRMEMPWAK